MVVLLFFTIVINPRLKAKLGFDLPINLILVIMLTIISHFADFHKKFHVSVVGEVPFGMPTPGIPNFAILPNIYVDILVLTTISFAMTISMAMLMAKIHGYDIDSNQELIAYGICNVGCSFFFSQATSVSPPRTMILSNTGAKTMLNGIPTVLFLFIMFFAGGMLEALPIPYLAAMIIVSVKDLLLQFLSLKKIWKISKSDFVVWILTWLMTVFADLPWGIVAGMAIAIFGNIINNQLIQGSLIVVSNKEDLILKGEHRLGVHNPTGIKIFYFPSQLFFANAEVFKKQMFNNVFDPTNSKDLSYHLGVDDPDEMALVTESVHCIIIDCSAMTYMDMDGVNMLKMVILLYRQAGVQMLLVRVGQDAMRVMENAELFQILPRSCIFHDVEDALANEQKTRVGVSRLSMTVTTPYREDSLEQFLESAACDDGTGPMPMIFGSQPSMRSVDQIASGMNKETFDLARHVSSFLNIMAASSPKLSTHQLVKSTSV
ncbi:unnamed protein product [Lymnaea stagnalis]|uniref:STAS domain-containing protein n=1 Tax=Lymnaea stagnalis TaxID=6523 RepID=A0AAV2ICN2_LYMST